MAGHGRDLFTPLRHMGIVTVTGSGSEIAHRQQ